MTPSRLIASLLFLALTLPPLALRAQVSQLELIDQAWQKGQIDQGTRLLYRLFAIRAPERLPAALRDNAAPPTGCVTPYMMEIAAALPHLDDGLRKMMAPLLLPTPSVGVVQSTQYPIWIHYETAEELPHAEAFLPFLESSWQMQVEDIGMVPPMTDDENGDIIEGIRYHVNHRGPGASYALPQAGIDETPRTDCLVYIESDRTALSLGDDWLRTLSVHEFHHALQMAQDCVESSTAYELTATTMELILLNEGGIAEMGFDHFQSQPYQSLDNYDPYGSAPYYHYGASLFTLFLEEAFGARDGNLVNQIWKNTVQNGTVNVMGGMPFSAAENEPDIFDAIDAVTQNLGETGLTMDEAYVLFMEWRYFLGNNDDGQHFKEGDRWVGAEVAIQASHTPADLPVVEAEVAEGVRPRPYGGNFIELTSLDLAAQETIRVEFAGDERLNWAALVLVVGQDNSVQVYPITLEGGAGHVDVSNIPQSGSLILAVANLGDGTYDPDDPVRTPGTYTYSLLLEADPIIETVTPNQAMQGVTGLTVAVTGRHFQDGVVAIVSGEGIMVTQTSRDDSRSLTLLIDVAQDAAPGSRDLTVINLDGSTGTAEGALTVVETPTPVITAVEPAEGHQGEGMIVVIEGTGFATEGEVAVSFGEAIVVEEVNALAAERLAVTIAIAADALVGPRDVTVTNPLGKAATAAGIFTVLEATMGEDASGTIDAAVVEPDGPLADGEEPVEDDRGAEVGYPDGPADVLAVEPDGAEADLPVAEEDALVAEDAAVAQDLAPAIEEDAAPAGQEDSAVADEDAAPKGDGGEAMEEDDEAGGCGCSLVP